MKILHPKQDNKMIINIRKISQTRIITIIIMNLSNQRLKTITNKVNSNNKCYY